MIKVYSHPRSGNHFLCSFLNKNFYSNVDISIGPYEWGHWSNRKVNSSGSHFGKLAATHQFLSDLPYEGLGPSIYIYRDGRSVALSLWRSDNFLNPSTRPATFSDFLRMKLDWRGTPGCKSTPNHTIAQHWCRHVHEWRAAPPKKVLLVRYEDLLETPESVYVLIRDNFFPLKKLKEIFFPKNVILENKTVGLAPKITSRELSWDKVFTLEDNQFFRSQVCEDCREILSLYS